MQKKVRLQKEEIDCLKDSLKQLSSDAKLYLFGSRVDETKKGGDIDLLIISKKLTKRDMRLLRIEFFKRFGEQKLDIVLDDGKMKDPFIQHIFQKAVLL